MAAAGVSSVDQADTTTHTNISGGGCYSERDHAFENAGARGKAVQVEHIMSNLAFKARLCFNRFK